MPLVVDYSILMKTRRVVSTFVGRERSISGKCSLALPPSSPSSVSSHLSDNVHYSNGPYFLPDKKGKANSFSNGRGQLKARSLCMICMWVGEENVHVICKNPSDLTSLRLLSLYTGLL